VPHGELAGDSLFEFVLLQLLDVHEWLHSVGVVQGLDLSVYLLVHLHQHLHADLDLIHGLSLLAHIVVLVLAK